MQATPQLIALTGSGGAESFLAAERALLSLEHARRAQHEAEVATDVLAARKEVEALKSKLREFETQSQIRNEHLQEMQRLKASGLTTRRGIVVTRTEVTEIQARKLDLDATVALAEARLAKAERTRLRVSFDHAAELVKAISATDAEISEVRLSLEAAGHLSAVLEQRSSRMARSIAPARPTYEIVRVGRDGPLVISAEETTQLMPGDVLKIRLDPPSRTILPQGSREQAGYQSPSWTK
jgi:exopolysaccharide production protein ExoF